MENIQKTKSTRKLIISVVLIIAVGYILTQIIINNIKSGFESSLEGSQKSIEEMTNSR